MKIWRVAVLGTIILYAAGTAASGDSVSSHVSESNRSANSLILEIMLNKNLTEALGVARALGTRTDPYVSDILAALFARTNGPASDRVDILFRTVIEYVFLRPLPFPEKIAANQGELESLLNHLQAIGDAGTKGALLEIAAYLPRSPMQKPLLDEGAFLERYLAKSNGLFTPDRLAEGLSYLTACRTQSNPVLRDEVIRLVELSRDTRFVQAARSYLRSSK